MHPLTPPLSSTPAKSFMILLLTSIGGQTEMKKTRIQKVRLGDRTVLKITVEPGWNWTECIGSNIPNCPTKCTFRVREVD